MCVFAQPPTVACKTETQFEYVTRCIHVFARLVADSFAQSVLSNKISASELSRKFIKSALLVGYVRVCGRRDSEFLCQLEKKRHFIFFPQLPTPLFQLKKQRFFFFLLPFFPDFFFFQSDQHKQSKEEFFLEEEECHLKKSLRRGGRRERERERQNNGSPPLK